MPENWFVNFSVLIEDDGCEGRTIFNLPFFESPLEHETKNENTRTFLSCSTVDTMKSTYP